MLWRKKRREVEWNMTWEGLVWADTVASLERLRSKEPGGAN